MELVDEEADGELDQANIGRDSKSTANNYFVTNSEVIQMRNKLYLRASKNFNSK